MQSVGLDVVDIQRIRALLKPARAASLRRLFTSYERTYCLRHKDPAPHFAGLFAAKEAASKALGTERYPLLSLEVRHRKDGAPEVWRGSKRAKVQVSITHTRTFAAAVAVI